MLEDYAQETITKMTNESDSLRTPHPNPFTLAKIDRFYQKSGLRVEISTGKNLYVIRKDGKPWARIAYRPLLKEWFLESWQPQSMIVSFWQHKAPCQSRLNCWCREEDKLKKLEQALETTLEFPE